MHYVTVIIPAFNEEKTIGKVISTVKEVDLVDNIIVVSDGSYDRTPDIAKSYGVEVVELKNNIGKGGAIKKGLEESEGDIILFLDADLLGLKPEHITELLIPVINNKCEMTIGLFSHGRFTTDLAQKVAPYLSGQRAIKRYILEQISNLEITRYGVEVAMTRFVAKNDIGIKEVILKDLTHVMKEEKLGVIKGFTARLKMYWDIVKCIKLWK